MPKSRLSRGPRVVARVLVAGALALTSVVAGPAGTAVASSEPNVRFVHQGLYTIHDSAGRCLGSNAFFGGATVGACTGSAGQTWQAWCYTAPQEECETIHWLINQANGKCLTRADTTSVLATLAKCGGELSTEQVLRPAWYSSFDRYYFISGNSTDKLAPVSTSGTTSLVGFTTGLPAHILWTVYAVA